MCARSRNFLGDERWNRMYAFNAIIDSGATVTFSSDVVTTYEVVHGSLMMLR